MKTQIIDDLMQMAGGAVSALSSFKDQVKEEAKEIAKHVAQKIIDENDLVRREEFETVKAMAEKARAENAELRKELNALKGVKPPSTKTSSNTTPKKNKPIKKVSKK